MLERGRDLRRSQFDPAIRLRTCQRHPRFKLDVPRGTGGTGLHGARFAVSGRVFHGRNPGTQEVRVEAGDDIGLREKIARQHSRAVSLPVSVQDWRSGQGIVDDVARVREALQEAAYLRVQNRAGDSLRQYSDRALLFSKAVEGRGDLRIDIQPGGILSARHRLLKAQAVIQPEDRGLADNAKATARHRVFRVSLQLDGPAIAALGKQPAGCTAPAADAGVVIRTPRRDAFRLAQHRDRLLHRRTPASGEGGSGKHEAGGPQELPAPRFGCFTESSMPRTRFVAEWDGKPRRRGGRRVRAWLGLAG